MASQGKKERQERLCREILLSAPGFILLAGIDGSWVDHLCRHYGYTSRKLSGAFPTKAALIDFILSRHLSDAFEVVCVPSDWQGPPMDVLRSMSLALICYGTANLERHRVFLTEYERRPDAARQLLAQQLVHLANNFQVALHAVTPGRAFDELHAPAGILLGQLLHAPLWWPAESGCHAPSTTLDAWICTQLGLLTGLRRPDHRKPSRATLRPSPPADEDKLDQG